MHGFPHPRKDDFVLTFLLLIPSEDELQAMWTCTGTLREGCIGATADAVLTRVRQIFIIQIRPGLGWLLSSSEPFPRHV